VFTQPPWYITASGVQAEDQSLSISLIRSWPMEYLWVFFCLFVCFCVCVCVCWRFFVLVLFCFVYVCLCVKGQVDCNFFGLKITAFKLTLRKWKAMTIEQK